MVCGSEFLDCVLVFVTVFGVVWVFGFVFVDTTFGLIYGCCACCGLVLFVRIRCGTLCYMVV